MTNTLLKVTGLKVAYGGIQAVNGMRAISACLELRQVMDVHARFRTEAHQDVVGRY